MKKILNLKKKLALALSVLMLSVPTAPLSHAAAVGTGVGVAAGAAVALGVGIGIHKRHERQCEEGTRDPQKCQKYFRKKARMEQRNMSANKKYAQNDMSPKNRTSASMNKKDMRSNSDKRKKIAQLKKEITNLEAQMS